MRRGFYIPISFSVLVLSGCSFVSTGEYFTAQLGEDVPSINRADWLMDTSEPSFGNLRPPLKRVGWSDSKNSNVVVYPIIITEKAISFGPAFLPLIPVFDSWQDPPSEYSGKIRLLYEGAKEDVDGLEIIVDGDPVSTRAHDGEKGEFFIVSDVLNTKGNQLVVMITFRGVSQTFHFTREKTRCFVPFTSFN